MDSIKKVICGNNCCFRALIYGKVEDFYFYAGRTYDIKKVKEKQIDKYAIFVDFDLWIVVNAVFVKTHFIYDENSINLSVKEEKTLLDVDKMFEKMFFCE